MPTYAYACTECDHHFEVRQSFTEDALTDCPQCDGRLRKLFNAVGVVFKGSGFYRTDSRSSNTASVGAGSSANSADGSGSSSGTASAGGTGSAKDSGAGTSSGGTKSESSSPAASGASSSAGSGS